MKSSAKYEIKMLLQNRGVSDDAIKTILEHDYLFDRIVDDIIDSVIETIDDEFEAYDEGDDIETMHVDIKDRIEYERISS